MFEVAINNIFTKDQMTMCNMKWVILVWRGRETLSEQEREIMAWGGWNLRNWAKQMGVRGGVVSFQILPGHLNREERVTQREYECEWVSSQCSCVPVLHKVGTEIPLTETNELRATSFSHPKWASVYWVYWVHLHSKYKVIMTCLFAVVSLCYWFSITTDDSSSSSLQPRTPLPAPLPFWC